MKQSFCAICIVMLVMAGQASAQTSATSFITKTSAVGSPFVSGKTAPTTVVNVSATALARFRKDYRHVKYVQWTEVPNGYRAYFLQDAVRTAVDYTKKGKLYSVIRYGQHLLSPDIRTRLERTFDGLLIREVTEVKIADFAAKAYVVLLEDKTSLKTVQIIEDEISVVYEVEK